MGKSFDFHYKNTRMFDNVQTPGLCVYGEKGLTGDEGVNGSSVYFVNEKDITSANKSKYLNYINQSMNLNGEGLYTRGYSEDDLVICMESDGMYNSVYKLVKATGGSFKFDFEYVGRISSSNVSVDILDVITFSINIGDNKIEQCLVPVNRSFDKVDTSTLEFSYINSLGENNNPATPYEKALRCLFGFSIKPKITIKSGYREHYENYDFYLKIRVKNKKSILGKNSLAVGVGLNDRNNSNESIVEEPVSTRNNIDCVKFEKIIEIPVSKYLEGTEESEEYTEYFISDMTCDKLHPSHNNFCTSFFIPYTSNGYKTDAKTQDSSNLYGFRFYKQKVSNNSYQYIFKGTTKDKIEDQSSNIFDVIISKLTGENAFEYQNKSDEGSAGCDYIQYSKKKSSNTNLPCMINFRSGESAYFSGMVLDENFDSSLFFSPGDIDSSIASLANNTYDQYVAAQRSLNPYCKNEYNEESKPEYTTYRQEKVRDFVCSEMRKFIFDENNTFELICINNQTGAAKIKNINI